MPSTDRLSAEEIIAAEAKHARERMATANVKHPERWLAGWFNALAVDHPHLRSQANRSRFIQLATASSQGES